MGDVVELPTVDSATDELLEMLFHARRDGVGTGGAELVLRAYAAGLIDIKQLAWLTSEVFRADFNPAL